MIGDRILRAVASYLWGDVTLGEFARSLPDGWDLDDQGASQDERRTLLRILGYLNELQRGRLSEEAFRLQLAAIVMTLATSRSGTFGFASLKALSGVASGPPLGVASGMHSDPVLVRTS